MSTPRSAATRTLVRQAQAQNPRVEQVLEYEPLIDASVEGPCYIPDFVIVFPRTVAGQEDSTPRFSDEQLAAVFDELLTERDGVVPRRWSGCSTCSTNDPEPSDAQEHAVYSQCESLCSKAKGGEVTRDAVQNAILEDLVAFLKARHCTAEAFMSCDRDELFVLISVGNYKMTAQDDPDACALAQHMHVRLQTVFGEQNIGKLKMKQVLHRGEEMYYPFSKEVSCDATRLLGIGQRGSYDLYRKYAAGIGGTAGSILRTVDRYRLIKSVVLDSFIDLEEAVTNGIVKSFYVPHKLSKLEEFRSGKEKGAEDWDTGHKAWANFRFRTIFGGLCEDVSEAQPFAEIRDYFGERIAFYFMWLGYTARFTLMLVPMSVAMSAIYSWEEDASDERVPEVAAAAHLFSAFYFCVASAFYLKFWTRLQSHYAELWDMGRVHGISSHNRAGYRGDMKENPLNMLQRRKEYSWVKAWGVKFVSRAVTLFFTTLVITSVAGIYRLETWIPSRYPNVSQDTATSISSAVFSMQILLYQQVWDFVSDKLVDLSNPRTEEEAKNLAVEFLFPFSVVSAYSNIIYHAFFKTWNTFCVTEDCMNVMRPSLYQVVLPAVLMQFVSLVRPFATYRYDLMREATELQKKLGPNSKIHRSFVETQAKRLPFDIAALNKEMNLMMILLGYGILFGFVAPAILIAVSITFWLKIRIDGFKLCSVYQRVSSSVSGVSGIGEWNSTLVLISQLGRWTSLAIPIFNLKYFQESPARSAAVNAMLQIKRATTIHEENALASSEGEAVGGLTFFQKVALLLAFKFAVDWVCDLVDWCISDISAATELLRQKREAVRQKMAFELVAAKVTPSQMHAGGQDQECAAGARGDEWLKKVVDGSLPKLDAANPAWTQFDAAGFAPLTSLRTYYGK